jgi:hypothetical protein
VVRRQQVVLQLRDKLLQALGLRFQLGDALSRRLSLA